MLIKKENDSDVPFLPDFEDIKKLYEGSEAFSRYEKAYYKVKEYENLVNHYPGCPTKYFVIKTNGMQKIISEDSKDSISMEQGKQYKSVGYNNLFLPKERILQNPSSGELLDTKHDNKPGF